MHNTYIRGEVGEGRDVGIGRGHEGEGGGDCESDLHGYVDCEGFCEGEFLAGSVTTAGHKQVAREEVRRAEELLREEVRAQNRFSLAKPTRPPSSLDVSSFPDTLSFQIGSA